MKHHLGSAFLWTLTSNPFAFTMCAIWVGGFLLLARLILGRKRA